MAEYRATLKVNNLKLAVAVSQFNEFITKRLLDGALAAIKEQGEPKVDVYWVPGSFELPVIVKKLAATGNYDAIICLGAIVKGETAHFKHIAEAVTAGLTEISLQFGLPVTFGVLTAYSTDQALERAGGKHGNKGREAALAAIEAANLVKLIEGGVNAS